MRRWLVLAAYAAAMAGCSGDSTGYDALQPGESSVVVTGAAPVRFTGTASSGPRNRAYAQIRVVMFDAAGNQVDVMSADVSGFRMGSNPIGMNDRQATAMFHPADGSQYGLASGTLFVESITMEGITGRLEFDAFDFYGREAQNTVHVRADFNAKRPPVAGG